MIPNSRCDELIASSIKTFEWLRDNVSDPEIIAIAVESLKRIKGAGDDDISN